jgi:2,5-diketo-D-gluconate reductase A
MSETKMKLRNGNELPAVGFGTYLIPDEHAADAVTAALEAGYRHIDTAQAYRNEVGVGAAIRAFVEAGKATRDELFVTTKVFPGNPDWGMAAKSYETCVAALEASLERLGLGYVDLYLIHAPFCVDERLNQWRALVDLRERGLTKAIGVSNYNIAHIDEIRDAGMPLPDANQIELHPWSQKPELVAYLQENGILPIAYSSLIPLASWRTAPGQASSKTDAMRADGEDDASPFKAMAEKYGVTEAQVLLRWAVQLGYPVLPKSTKPERIRQNFDLLSFELDSDDMGAIAEMDRGEGVAWQSGDPINAS